VLNFRPENKSGDIPVGATQLERAKMRRLRQSIDMQTPGVLNKIITDAWIQTEAGDLYYDRGLDYFEEGRVSALQQRGQTILARVTGTEDYSVVLTLKAETVTYHCDCPGRKRR
jgi:hypothetical protein